MKPKAIYVGILFSLVIVFNSSAQQDEFPVLKGPYLGQKSPGMTPEVFAPGIISTDDWEGCSCLLDKGNIFIFRRRIGGKPKILMMKHTFDGWSDASPVPFIGEYDCNDFTPGSDG